MLQVMFDPDTKIVGHGKVAESSMVSDAGQTIRRERPGEANDLRAALLPALKRVMQVSLAEVPTGVVVEVEAWRCFEGYLADADEQAFRVSCLHMSRDESKRPMWVASRPVLIASDAFQ